MKSLLLVLFTCLIFNVQASTSFNLYSQLHTINRCWEEQHDITGLNIFGNPQKVYSDQELIQLHLQLVEQILRARSTERLTEVQKAARLQNLDHLHQYWLTNTYPTNNKVAYRNPVFIDDYNVFCAVGYLIKTSGHEPLARSIAATQNLSYLRDMQHPGLNQWVKESGLTLDELAWIQPTYYRPMKDRSLGKGVNGTVYALAANDKNKILYVGGSFTEADSTLACNNIVAVRYDESNIFNNTFYNLGEGLNGRVYALYADGQNVYAGGDFDHSGNQVLHHISKWNGNTWEAMEGLNGTVYAITKYHGRIYAGGQFSFTQNNITYYNMAYWNGTTWNPLFDTIDGRINAFTIYSDKLIVGGAFTKVNTSTVNFIFSYNDTMISPIANGVTAQVRALSTFNAIYDSTRIFLSAGGDLKKNQNDTNYFGIQIYRPSMGWMKDYKNIIENQGGSIERVNSISGEMIGGKLKAYYMGPSTNTGYYGGGPLFPYTSTGKNNEVFAMLHIGNMLFWGGTIDSLVDLDIVYPISNLVIFNSNYVFNSVYNPEYKAVSFDLLPNPSANITTIKSSSPIQGINIKDITGRTIFETSLSSLQKEYRLERNIFPKSGIYFVSIQTESGMPQSQKLVIE